MKTVLSNDGTLIAYQETGSGPPLVLVHGTSADHTRWNPVLPLLEQKFTVYAVDRRGRGMSADKGKYSFDREFEDIAGLVDTIGQPVYLLGHSFGAFCSLGAALLTENIEKLILYEPPPPDMKGTIPVQIINKLQKLSDTGDHEGVLITFLQDMVGIPVREIEVMSSHPSWKGRVTSAHTILREISESPAIDLGRIKTICIPILLLTGGDSPPIFTDFIKILGEILPENKLVVLPGQQHMAMATAPELFVSEIVKFLNH